MYGFLRHYNLQDVVPFATAIENCFRCYNEHFGVNAITSLSLPAVANTAMFNLYDKEKPLVVTFNNTFKEINQIFRRSIYGGLVNAFRRHVKTFDDDKVVPHSARYASNGNPFTSILSLDFTSMYLSCQMQDMPTTPGILWTMKPDGTYKKNVMVANHSFRAQQWLTYCQHYGNVILILQSNI